MPSGFRRSLPSICRCRKGSRFPFIEIDKHAQVGFNVFNILNHFSIHAIYKTISTAIASVANSTASADIPRKNSVLEF